MGGKLCRPGFSGLNPRTDQWIEYGTPDYARGKATWIDNSTDSIPSGVCMPRPSFAAKRRGKGGWRIKPRFTARRRTKRSPALRRCLVRSYWSSTSM